VYIDIDTTTSYTFTGTNVCGQTLSESFTVHVGNGSSFIPPKATICPGDSDLLTLIGFASDSVVPANKVIRIDALNFYLVPDTTTTFTITGLTTCGDNYSQGLNVAVLPPPIAYAFPRGDTPVCANDSVLVCASPGMVAYEWNTGETGTCVEVHFAGNYYATVTDQNGCTALSGGVNIAIRTNPVVTVTVSGDTLTAYNSPYYQWYDNGNEIIGANNRIYIATQPGTYTVGVLDTFSCPARSTPVSITTVGIADINGQNGVFVYPNPTSTSWNIEVDGNWIGSQYEIYDADGQIVMKGEIKAGKTEVQGDFASGIYVVKVHNDVTSFITRLMKM
jgi:hypothetical protein